MRPFRSLAAQPLHAAAIGVLLAAVVWLALRQPGPAHARVRVSLRPQGMLSVDGAADVSTPASVELTPGAHVLRVYAPGFHARDVVFHAEAGRFHELDLALAVADATNPDVLNRFLASHHLANMEHRDIPRFRGCYEGPPIWLIYPRDQLRPADAETLRFDADERSEGPVTIRFKTASGEELERMEWRAEEINWVNRRPLPQGVIERIARGEALEWFVAEHPNQRGRLMPSEDTASAEWERLDRILQAWSEPPTEELVLYARVSILLEHGFHTAAFRTLENVESKSYALALLEYEAVRRLLRDTQPLDWIVQGSQPGYDAAAKAWDRKGAPSGD